MDSVSTQSVATATDAFKHLSQLRDNDYTAKTMRTMISDVEGRKPRKKKPQSQGTIVYNTMHNSGVAFSATIGPTGCFLMIIENKPN